MRIPHDVPVALGKQFVELSADITAAILLALWDGWEYAARFEDVTPRAGEVAITERLRDGMRSALKEKRHPWSKSMVVLPGTESRSNSTILIPDGRTDIPIFWVQIFQSLEEHEPHSVVECKRIAGDDTYLCRQYVVEGVDRFRSGKYGQNHAVGFMTGYVISGTAAEAASGINAYLTRASRNPEHLQPASIAPPTLNWTSNHSRTPPSPPIGLYHSFFGFSSPS